MGHSAAAVIRARDCFKKLSCQTQHSLLEVGILVSSAGSERGQHGWELAVGCSNSFLDLVGFPFETSAASPGSTTHIHWHDMASARLAEKQMTKVEVQPHQAFVHGHGVFRDQRSPNQATVRSKLNGSDAGVPLVSSAQSSQTSGWYCAFRRALWLDPRKLQNCN